MDSVEIFLKRGTINPKIEKALAIIEGVLDSSSLDNKELYFTFNGGKDCTVLLYLLLFAIVRRVIKMLKIPQEGVNAYKDEIIFFAQNTLQKIPVAFFKGKNEFPEILEFVDLIKKLFPIQVVEYDLSVQKMEQILAKIVDEGNLKYVLIGERETDKGEKKVYAMSTGKFPKMCRIHPILDWTYAEVWEFLLGYDCKYCVLYDRGYTSIGMIDNSAPNPELLNGTTGTYMAAHKLADPTKERAGRPSKH